MFDDAHCCQGNTTFPRVLFMLIVLFLPLSSSCFWPETQSTKCECPPGFEFTLVVSLRPSSVLLLLFVSVSLPLRHSYWNHLSPPVPLLSSHTSHAATKQLFDPSRKKPPRFFEKLFAVKSAGETWAKVKVSGKAKREDHLAVGQNIWSRTFNDQHCLTQLLLREGEKTPTLLVLRTFRELLCHDASEFTVWRVHSPPPCMFTDVAQ